MLSKRDFTHLDKSCLIVYLWPIQSWLDKSPSSVLLDKQIQPVAVGDIDTSEEDVQEVVTDWSE